MKIKIKQVPDAEPNADGEWVERDADVTKLNPRGEWWGHLTSLCDPGHHAVSYEKA